MELKPKERLLRALRGQETDRTAWAPFLAYYWDFLDEDTRIRGMVDYYRQMGADPLLRGTVALHETQFNRCEIHTIDKGTHRITRYETPVGTLTEEYRYSGEANSWFLTGHPVQTDEDFKVLYYLFEHLNIIDTRKSAISEYQTLGDDGLIVPVIGSGLKTSFQSLVEHWCGTEGIVYAVYDYPELVTDCLSLMQERDKEIVQMASDSPFEAFIFWEDSSTTNISPTFFEQYTLPQINNWGEMLHQSDKLLIHHACGHLRDLAKLIASSSIDALESVSPPPTGNISVQEIRKVLPPHIALIGGIEPTILRDSSIAELTEHVTALLEDMKGSRYILANSDSCPPDVEYEKFEAITALITTW